MDDDDRLILLAFSWTLIAFKLVTSALVLFFFPSVEALVVVVVLSVPWVIGAFVYFGMYTRIKMRLVRARARRRRLIYQEWNVD